MTAQLLYKEERRWYPLKNHPVQLALVNAVRNGIRFPVVPAGRRSGKTERFKRFITKEAMRNAGESYFAGAPTRDQAKKIFWNDLKLLSFSSKFPKKPSETELKIFFPNDSTITVLGLDEPARFEGIPWTGGGIDEFGNLKENAWQENIMPALDTVDPRRPDYRAWCWIFGVPEGMNHYYNLFDYAMTANDPLWEVFHWKSAEILPQDVIESAKRILSLKQFKQEYEASFETATGRIYDDYGPDNYTEETIKPHEQLLWYHDFNFTPMSSGIGVKRNNSVYLLDEIILSSAVSSQAALEFVEKYKNHQNKHVIIYGDPSGRAGEKHGHVSDYIEIETVLRNNGWKYTRRVKPSTVSIKDGQNAVRAKIKNAAGDASLFVNTKKAPYTHKSLSAGTLKKGSSFLEEESEFQHIGTAVRYFIDYEFPITYSSGQSRTYGT
ncbi:MAG: hypothetical protein KBC53_00190 [Nitrosomonas sp.]|nr:hypothetical protein [Nitrosomonas sp.]